MQNLDPLFAVLGDICQHVGRLHNLDNGSERNISLTKIIRDIAVNYAATRFGNKRVLTLTLALFSSFLLVISNLACASGDTPGREGPAPYAPVVSLTMLASRADFVAVVQVKDTDYVYTRSFPSEGSAFLKPLITYKSTRPGQDIVEVYEKGLHPNECYFENPTVLEEGRRYLVFFRLDPQDPDNYRGFAEGCALEILVTEDNRYVLKYPLDGIELTDNVGGLASPYNFRDNYALISEEALSPTTRDDLLTRGLIIPYQGKFKYTSGVDLTALRKLIDIKALSPQKNR